MTFAKVSAKDVGGVLAKDMAKAKKKPEPKKVGESDEEIVRYIQSCKKEADEASKERRTAWKELWSLFQNKQDYKAKQDWQSKAFVPKLWMKVERASAEVKRALLQIEKLFKFAQDDELEVQEAEKEKVREEIARQEKKFKRKIDKSNLANVYAEMSKAAFLLGLGVPKVLWSSEKKNVTFEDVNILNLYTSPDFKPFQDDRPKYVIEEKEMDLATFKRMAKKVNKKAGSSIYDMSIINTIEEDFKETEKTAKERTQRGISQHIPVSKKVLLWEFWGDIIPKEGDDIKENQLIVVANKKHKVRHQDNPFSHKKPPYIWSFPLVYPHRGIAGTSLIEPTAKLQYIFNNILNMFVDNLNFTVNKMYEFNPNILMNPENVLNVYPGKTIPVQSSGNEPALREVVTSPAFRDAVAGLEIVGREIDEGTAVAEFLTGMPGRKPKTLGEVEIKTAEQKGLFDIIARDLEKNSIKPLLEMSYSLCVQFDKFPDNEGIFVFKVGGLSLLLMQKEQTDRIMQIMGLALKSPQLEKITDIDDLWRKLLGIYNLSDVYTEEQEVSPETMEGLESQGVKDAKAAVSQFGPEEAMKRMKQRKVG